MDQKSIKEHNCKVRVARIDRIREKNRLEAGEAIKMVTKIMTDDIGEHNRILSMRGRLNSDETHFIEYYLKFVELGFIEINNIEADYIKYRQERKTNRSFSSIARYF